MTTHCCKLTIFEGPDGSGKTTAAKAFAEQTGARYVHFSALPRVSDSLGRIYVEAMLPALLGYQDVVFDRSWLSEVPYGTAFREGYDRLGDASRRMLERLAFRCGAVVVRCDPGWASVKASFLARKHLEMLDNDNQLFEVYTIYRDRDSDLPTLVYNYAENAAPLPVRVSEIRPLPHPVGRQTAGKWAARFILVGETFGEVKNQDAFYQWPFASFSRIGCSQWLAGQLDIAGVRESDLMWANADQDLGFLTDFAHSTCVGLGHAAASHLRRLPWAVGTKIYQVPHPQFHKRFGAPAKGNPYELTTLLKGLTR